MSTAQEENYLTTGNTIKSWLLTLDHKRIGILYLVTLCIFFMIGGVAAFTFRMELMTPDTNFLEPENYNKLFTTHGIVMIFFFLIPSIPAVIGNFVLPLMLGAKDVAMPRLNLASWYIFVIGAVLALTAVITGGIDTGWTFYTPYSSTYANGSVALAGIAVFITGFSSILTGLNFIVTIHKMRAPGLSWFKLPLFVWAQYATSIINVLGTPVIAITVLLLAFEKAFDVAIFDPRRGGDPVLFQHLFWFYSHPAVYIMILPGFGVISEIVSCFSRKRIFGYEFIALSSLGIAFLGFFVWGHHMFVSSQSAYAGILFSVLTFLIGIPTAMKMFNWVATMYKGSIKLDTPMIYALGFFGLFMVGGLTGLHLASMGMDIHLHDTYFVVAHFHYVMVGGMVFAWLAGIHFWFPKMFGRMYPPLIAKITAVVIFIGFNITFFPQFILGYMGMPRRYATYPEEWQLLNMVSSIGAITLGIGFMTFFAYIIWGIVRGPKCGPNPWTAFGFEWTHAGSPPTLHNFDEAPKFTARFAYDYEDESIYETTPAQDGEA